MAWEWQRCSLEGEVRESFQCIRRFRQSADGTQIDHENQYTYSDGRQESKIFGPYRKPVSRSYFLEQCFTWGSPEYIENERFGFETGLRHGDRRISAVAMFGKGSWQSVTIVRERLGTFDKTLYGVTTEATKQSTNGKLLTMTPTWETSGPQIVNESPGKAASAADIRVPLPGGIELMLPRAPKPGAAFTLAVDWQPEQGILLRGTRHYGANGLDRISLTTWNS